ncbi:hypothetical protein RUE5091_02917 [Ruegeria denitrificans]|uniref:Uncharacterized protein n=1 Tax=Ruegeria denitrificans TaxID=1715692 RepID=A0A0P1IDQ7_9RHOB|nr:hypothetical protein [Ruegeria denitrificans]CUK07288.1 hypothetical protein RUE5091_02917 [Ruegeria denitrificans]
MGWNRRKVVQLGTAATVGTLLPRVAAAATDQNEAFEQEFGKTIDHLRKTFLGLGFNEAAPLSIASGRDDFNEGLRHDFDQSALPSNAFVIQPLARVADVDEKSRADVLPLFHEVGCHPADADGQTTTRLMLRILTEGFDLDPARIAFVSVPQSEDMRAVLDEMALPFTEKVLLRDEAEALAARDASGFFFPDPFGDAYIVTMGVYYRVGGTNESAPAAYPPSANWTEIGEIVIGGEAAPLGISIGSERLTYARTGQYPTWDQRLGLLFAAAEQDGAEPPGLTAFR